MHGCCECCVLRRADQSPRGALPSVVCVSVNAKPRKEAPLGGGGGVNIKAGQGAYVESLIGVLFIFVILHPRSTAGVSSVVGVLLF